MVDLNDPETKKELDAFLEHEKHETAEEKAEDLGNREPPWVWASLLIALLAGFGAFVRWCL